MSLDIRPATHDLWPALRALFGPQGVCYGCRCSYFRLAPKQRLAMSRDDREELLKAATAAPLPPGLIAIDNKQPIGWVQVTPRAHVPRWNTSRTVSRPLDGDDPDDAGLWAVSCFFITANRRGEGHSRALLDAAVDHAACHGALILEACPMEQAKHSKSPSLYVGSRAVFEKAGFETVAERKPGRPLMRKVLA